ncbi:MAG: hypothetical protein J6W86_00505, partial [Bacteroidales bacterium]|nr:hypothetical protein [Bacteroidales bacterium]
MKLFKTFLAAICTSLMVAGTISCDNNSAKVKELEAQLDSLRGQLISKLKDAAVEPEEGKTLCPDAYSADIGKFQVESDDGIGKEAEH